MLDHVYVLWYWLDKDDEDDNILLGIYLTEELANAAIERYKPKPGFREGKGKFHCDRYEVNRDHWEEGFIVAPELDAHGEAGASPSE